MSCMMFFYKDKIAPVPVHWSAARYKKRFSSRRQTADESRMYRFSIAVFVSAFGLN